PQIRRHAGTVEGACFLGWTAVVILCETSAPHSQRPAGAARARFTGLHSPTGRRQLHRLWCAGRRRLRRRPELGVAVAVLAERERPQPLLRLLVGADVGVEERGVQRPDHRHAARAAPARRYRCTQRIWGLVTGTSRGTLAV